MKRELAALETDSPVLNSIGRKTRSSARSSSGGGVSESLVYKRVKKSSSAVQVKKDEVLSNGVNGSVGVSRTSEVVSQQNGVHEAQKGANGTLEVEEKEVVKEVSDEARTKVVNGSSLVEKNGVLPRNVIVLGVAAPDVVMKKVEFNDGEERKGVVDEEGLKKSGEVVVGDQLHGNGDSVEGDEERLVEGVSKRSQLEVVVGDEPHANGVDGGVSKRSQLKAVNGKAKNAVVERYPRRFTRSALKSKVDDTTVVENGMVEPSAEKMKKLKDKPVKNETDGEVSDELAIVVYQMDRSKEEVKESSTEKYTRRFTRSASKLKVEESNVSSVENVNLDVEKAAPVTSNENVECDMDKHDEDTSSETPRRKLEMKMSKQISPARLPCTVQELFGTGMLEGCPVYYDGGKGPELHGRIRGIGILCSCGMCKDQKVIPPSLFEIHACNTYKRAVQYIYLENGRSLIQILKTCKSSRFNTLEATIQNAIGPLPEKKIIVCRNCKESFTTMDAESSEPVCSTCVMSNLSPIGPVYSTRKRCRSSKFTFPQAASACDIEDGSKEKSVGKSQEADRTPKVQTSQADLPSFVLQDRRRSKSVKKSADASQTQTLRRSSRFERISGTKTSEEVVKNSEEASVVPKACSSPVLGKSSEAKRHKKLKERSFKSESSLKPSKFSRMGKSSPRNDGAKSSSRNDGARSSKRLTKEILTPKPLKASLALASSEKKTSGKITRKDLRLHKLVFEDDVLPEGTELGYYARGQKLLNGYKKGSGIYCYCCDTVVSASQFEAHAGCATRRKPYCYIYTSNGVSLHELSVTLIKDRRHSAKYNDDLCSICADGGNLLLCDGCPRAFHKECASLPSIPVGKWYCKYCQNMFEREKFVAHNANAVAAGRVSGVDPIEQITKRSIRIVNNPASEVSACILCRGHDFCKSGFGPRTIILCDQCEKEYHVGCLKEHSMADLKELPDGKWFCSVDCGRIESSLQNLLVRGVEKLPGSFLDIIRKKSMQNGSDSGTDLDVSWRLLSGKIASPETRPLLSQAVAIFHESFAPIIDVVSGHDLIPAMVYGRNVGGQEYGGMYCAVLTVNSVVVSAGIFRIFGPEVAELPLVATSSGNHGKGYFQILFACIEKLLAFLKVKTIVLPAAEEAGSIWTDRFGFTTMSADELSELKQKFWSVVRFQGTSMLHKLVPKCPVTLS